MSATTLSRRLAVFFRDRFTCQYCGGSALKGDLSILALTIDHFNPRLVDGVESVDNYVTSCNVCNHVKGGNIFDTLEEARRFVQSQRRLREQWSITNMLVKAGYAEEGQRYNMLDLLFALGGQEVLV